MSQFSSWLPNSFFVSNNQQNISNVHNTSTTTTTTNMSNSNNTTTYNIVNNYGSEPVPAVEGNTKSAAELASIKKDIKDNCGYKVDDLKALLKSRGVKGISTLSKQELIDKCITMKLLNPVLIAAPVVEVSKPKVSRKRKAESSSTATSSSSIPPDYECPISMELMTDPVICSDGFSYERSAIEIWLKAHDRSPKTNETLPNKTLIPNKTLKAAIVTFKESIVSSTN